MCVRGWLLLLGGLWDRTRQHSLLERPSIRRLQVLGVVSPGSPVSRGTSDSQETHPHMRPLSLYTRGPRCVHSFPSGRKENWLEKP